MTVMDVLKKVYRKIEGDTDYPEFDDEDMQLYFAFLLESYDEWVKRFPTDTLTKPTLETDVITTIRPDYCYAHIMLQMTSEDDDKTAAKEAKDQMKDEERLEKGIRFKNEDGKTPTATGVSNSGNGQGYGVIQSEAI